jgi:hypothetical protein
MHAAVRPLLACRHHRRLAGERMRKTGVVGDEDEVQRIEAALHGEGWADHVTLARELRVWARLSAEVNRCTATVDDYTNDLCSRDYLAEFAARASSDLRTAIEGQVGQADEKFRKSTTEDADGAGSRRSAARVRSALRHAVTGRGAVQLVGHVVHRGRCQQLRRCRC